MGKWKKLTAFAPALAAVIVAACAGISLNGYTAPVYAVEQPEALVTPEPEQDTDAAEKKDDTKKKEDTRKTSDTEAEMVAAVGSGNFELADGAWVSREELRENYTGNGIALTSEMIAEFAAGRDPYSLDAKN